MTTAITNIRRRCRHWILSSLHSLAVVAVVAVVVVAAVVAVVAVVTVHSKQGAEIAFDSLLMGFGELYEQASFLAKV